jgi:hypothetical protein
MKTITQNEGWGEGSQNCPATLKKWETPHLWFGLSEVG